MYETQWILCRLLRRAQFKHSHKPRPKQSPCFGKMQFISAQLKVQRHLMKIFVIAFCGCAGDVPIFSTTIMVADTCEICHRRWFWMTVAGSIVTGTANRLQPYGNRRDPTHIVGRLKLIICISASRLCWGHCPLSLHLFLSFTFRATGVQCIAFEWNRCVNVRRLMTFRDHYKYQCRF